MQRVHASLEEGPQADGVGVSWAGPSEEEPAYRLLVDCNQLAVGLDNHLALVIALCMRHRLSGH